MTSMYSKEDEEALFRNYPRAALPYFGQHPAHANNNKDKQEDQDHENDDEGDNADVELDHDQYNYGWGRLLSIGYPDSGAGWIAIQISWRVVVSMAAALLVFYITTKPPPPKVSVKMVGLEQWELGEGVDGSGVNSKILNCNASINLVIENKSNLFPLHIHPPLLQMYFGRFLFATSKLDRELFAGSNGTTVFKLWVGTRNKAMYAAGRAMEDMLDSGEGLPVVVRLRFLSWFRVMSGVINVKFHHHSDCLLFLSKSPNNKRLTHLFNTTCPLISL
ncbi:unnamed protein product [Cuscuta epithymum]|uniref:Late embryogenesis abundant protein LEA-2 subgroup domain-containing protein n=1 Tax=Cuscuta epithymum TaxID=186058 RepID=A0AAV0CVE3_9ASTE|nr:unnamed protein product [Cuscuta epithymum]